MEDSFFKELSDKETLKFQQWAKDNYSPSKEMEEIWHPVVRKEWLRLASLGRHL